MRKKADGSVKDTIFHFLSAEMYRNTKKDWLSSVVTSAIGAGVVTSFAISQGQHPLIAFGVTGMAIAAALMIDHYA